MTPTTIYLPDGQTFTVKPVYGGYFFSSNELNSRHTPFPSGWTLNLHTEDDATAYLNGLTLEKSDALDEPVQTYVHKYKHPTLQHDIMFISSISQPSSQDYQPASSPSREIALMLWISLYWYFQQPEPSPYLDTAQSEFTPDVAKPKGDWRIRIKRDGVFRTRNMIPKLERMGLISTLDSAVGTSTVENAEGWDKMYVTRRSFWQIPFGLYLFSLQPKRASSHPGSPISSRPTSPTSGEAGLRLSMNSIQASGMHLLSDIPGGTIPISLANRPSSPVGPYFSASRQPTYYPPPPLQYIMTNGLRHPLRPKPPRMGEIFYTRFLPSVGKYLSFRVASASTKPVPSLGPVGPDEKERQEHAHLTGLDDQSLLQRWLSNDRVAAFWGNYHPKFLTDALESKHSFPAIGMWDGVPFGYFEIYWVKEDPLGHQMGGDAEDWDRGLHALIGEEWARGRVSYWLSSLVHWCWQADNRTMNVCLEPRVDNERFIQHLQVEGFSKDRQISFPHKQAWLLRLKREVWKGAAT
ncbi:acyl-CoA N-acyltransferase [Pseudomassariella vexata]|uniref:Acyl-CoA N-acyltransferase n=1 Tax=Pseudomassariella vexata TaxID=1141098 RepID=A0A1Y2DYZ5_9PEZI|nr:acyl-CoA N-acyltransferase [Pseudomassariella vexata]ORY64491.1 acyl-CoA N-acyltransferase [Pseudomassariella vexata]